LKLIILGDTHWGIRNDSDNFVEYFLKFYDDVLFPYIKKHKIKHIIQTGDLMDKRKGVNYKTLSVVSTKFFDKLHELHCEIHLIPGNHDIYYRHSTKVNSMTELFDWRNGVHIYNEATAVEFGKTKIDFLPWITKENHDDIMDFVGRSDSTIAVGHLELDGFEMFAGIKSSGGMSVKSFSDYYSVLSGHYHHRSSRDNIHYVGTPYEMTWADFGDTKGFHVLDTETHELEFVENPLKMFHKVFFSSSVDYASMNYDELTGSIVKMIVKDREDISKFEAVVSKINAAKPIDLTIVESDVTIVEGISEDQIEGVDTFNVLIAAARATAENENLNPEKMEKLLTELYNEAIDLGRDQ